MNSGSFVIMGSNQPFQAECIKVELEILPKLGMCGIVAVAINNLVPKVILIKAQFRFYICKLCEKFIVFLVFRSLQIRVLSCRFASPLL